MESVVSHLNENWKVYSVLITIGGLACIAWLGRYFATKEDLKRHVEQTRKDLDDQSQALLQHKDVFEQQRRDHYKLRDMVHAIDSHVKHLPTAKDIASLKEEMGLFRGRLEGVQPLLKQILNTNNMIVENEIRGDKKNGPQ